MTYRKRKGRYTWHWLCRWAGIRLPEDTVQEERPTSGELCDWCRRIESRERRKLKGEST